MIRMSQQQGFSLVEALIAVTIFAVATVGVFMTISAVKRPVVKTDRELTAAYFSQEILDGLRAKVDARDWNSGDLSLTPPQHTVLKTINQVTYNATYDVVQDGKSRRVILNVTWPDPQ